MVDIVRFAENLPFDPDMQVAIEQTSLHYNSDPESITHQDIRFYFPTENLLYRIKFYRPHIDKELLNDEEDFYRFWFSRVLSEDQETLIENAGFDISMIRIDIHKRTVYALVFDQAVLQEYGLKAKEQNAWLERFSGAKYTWEPNADRILVKDGKFNTEMLKAHHVYKYLSVGEEVEDRHEIAQLAYDILAKFRAAAAHHKHKQEELRNED